MRLDVTVARVPGQQESAAWLTPILRVLINSSLPSRWELVGRFLGDAYSIRARGQQLPGNHFARLYRFVFCLARIGVSLGFGVRSTVNCNIVRRHLICLIGPHLRHPNTVRL